MSSDEKAKELLEQLLSGLYAQESNKAIDKGPSYLIAANNQYLGRISSETQRQDNILNEYGPYGSPYSSTSIFNQYSEYGSPYGRFSVYNPYTQTPPKLFIDKKLLGYVTKNVYVQESIDTDVFLYALRNELPALLRGQIVESEIDARAIRGDTFIMAADENFLGSLNPNPFDTASLFNTFGPYGNRFSPTSIFNKFGTYGNQFSLLSPYNQFSSTPPKIFRGRDFYAFLTINQHLSPRLDPNDVLTWAKGNVQWA